MIILAILLFLTSADASCSCNGTVAVCNNIHTLKNLSRNVRSISLRNSCDFQISDWKNFTQSFPELEKLKFEPFCSKCLETDENFKPDLQVEGRCLISNENRKFNDHLSIITNEIASCIALLVMLFILCIIRFVKNEILQFRQHA